MAKAFIHIALFRQLKLTAMDMTVKKLSLNKR